MNTMPKKIVWVMSGSDTSGGSGMQNDIRTLADCNSHVCSIITCIVAQNNHEVLDIFNMPLALIKRQVAALQEHLFPDAIKLGLVKTVSAIKYLAGLLKSLYRPCVLDPILRASSGYSLLTEAEIEVYKQNLFPGTLVITPNVLEAEKLLGCQIKTPIDIERAASSLLSMGVANVIIKGGDVASELASDYWTDGKHYCWLSYPKTLHLVRGTGCAFASSLCAGLARGEAITSAFLKAKHYVFAAMQSASVNKGGKYFLNHRPTSINQLPSIDSNLIPKLMSSFLPAEKIGFYAIVATLAELKRLAALGVNTIQLRVKGMACEKLRDMLSEACAYAKAAKVNLYINDYWQLALELGAYGVHLGQEDLHGADLPAILAGKLRLGVSTHNEFELLKANQLAPSYIAMGPIFPTQYKPYLDSLSIEKVAAWRQLTAAQLLVIGGIRFEHISALRAAGADGVAFISAVQAASDDEIARYLHAE
jgi:hydroxymethylpyrimidine kinase / phosphomethylpyrimidine kinase / thiamine-phosphate diphosphorylase